MRELPRVRSEIDRLRRMFGPLPLMGREPEECPYASATFDRTLRCQLLHNLGEVRYGALQKTFNILYVFDASKILSIDSSNMALNSASDCCAVSPSTSAREKLATTP